MGIRSPELRTENLEERGVHLFGISRPKRAYLWSQCEAWSWGLNKPEAVCPTYSMNRMAWPKLPANSEAAVTCQIQAFLPRAWLRDPCPSFEASFQENFSVPVIAPDLKSIHQASDIA